MARGEPSDLSSFLARSLAAHYERVRSRLHALVEPLSEDELWRRPFPFGNSIGHLLLHLTGNLSYYIGAQILGSGYVRDRPMEFSDASRLPKQTVLAAFDAAVDTVLRALATQVEGDWSAPYGAVGADDISDRLAIFLRCMAHADHHLGQIIYLCKQLQLAAPEA